MRKFLASLGVAAILASTSVANPPYPHTFAWFYPYAVSQDTQFIVFETTNIPAPLSQWVPLTNVPASNAPGWFEVGIELSNEPPPNGHYFLTVAASNQEYGLGLTSNTCYTQPGVYPIPVMVLSNQAGLIGASTNLP